MASRRAVWSAALSSWSPALAALSTAVPISTMWGSFTTLFAGFVPSKRPRGMLCIAAVRKALRGVPYPSRALLQMPAASTGSSSPSVYPFQLALPKGQHYRIESGRIGALHDLLGFRITKSSLYRILAWLLPRKGVVLQLVMLAFLLKVTFVLDLLCLGRTLASRVDCLCLPSQRAFFL